MNSSKISKIILQAILILILVSVLAHLIADLFNGFSFEFDTEVNQTNQSFTEHFSLHGEFLITLTVVVLLVSFLLRIKQGKNPFRPQKAFSSLYRPPILL
jgi:surface polysaccharide O-acyltransferase-like enzyme